MPIGSSSGAVRCGSFSLGEGIRAAASNTISKVQTICIDLPYGIKYDSNF
nr:hypothetical protein [Oceanibacterium hippocampi]